MAKKRFLVVKDSFIGMQLIRADEKKIVTIETDPEQGGMRPGSNLVEVDEKDNPIAGDTAGKSKRANKAATPPATAGGEGNAGSPPTGAAAGSGNATDLA